MCRTRQVLWFSAMAIALASLAPSQAFSDVIYTTGATASIPPRPTGTLGASRDLGNYVLADDFMISQGAAWTDVHFWTYEVQGSLGPNVIQYYLFDSLPGTGFGTPLVAGSATSYTRQATGSTSQWGTEFYYSFDLSASYDLGTTSYWLALHFGEERALLSKSWITYQTPNGTGNYYFFQPGVSTQWQFTDPANKDAALAFELTGGAIPEPGSIILLGSGLVGLAGGIRRRLRNRC